MPSAYVPLIQISYYFLAITLVSASPQTPITSPYRRGVQRWFYCDVMYTIQLHQPAARPAAKKRQHARLRVPQERVSGANNWQPTAHPALSRLKDVYSRHGDD